MSIDRDDALLDALAQGAPGPDGDELAVLLAAWRDDIDADPAPEPPVKSRRATLPRNRGRFSGTSRPFGPGPAAGSDRPSRPKKRRLSRPVIIATLAAILATGGLTVASANAEPGGPLWPITRIVFSDRAQSKLAEQQATRLMAEARTAIDAGRPADAVPLLHEARAQILLVSDAGVRLRLQTEFNALLARLTQLAPPPAGSPNSGSGTAGSSPTPSPSSSPGGGLLDPILPILPILPSLLPSLPLPLPSLPIL